MDRVHYLCELGFLSNFNREDSEAFKLLMTIHVWVLSHFSCVQLFVTLWPVAHQALLSMEFSRQEYWSRVAMLSSMGSSQPRDHTCISCIASAFFTAEPLGKPLWWHQQRSKARKAGLQGVLQPRLKVMPLRADSQPSWWLQNHLERF